MRDASVVVNGTGRLVSYYVEGLRWLQRHAGIAGIYLDGISFGRETLRRARRVADYAVRDGGGAGKAPLFDVHPNNKTLVYLEYAPFFDSQWVGELADFSRGPDHYLVTMSGVPFGVPSQMLTGKNLQGTVFRGLLFGMTFRPGWHGPDQGRCAELWRAFDAYEVAELAGWWEDAPLVSTGNPLVKASLLLSAKRDKFLLVVASWAPKAETVVLDIAWDRLGVAQDAAKAALVDVGHFQEPRELGSMAAGAAGGWKGPRVEPKGGYVVGVR